MKIDMNKFLENFEIVSDEEDEKIKKELSLKKKIETKELFLKETNTPEKFIEADIRTLQGLGVEDIGSYNFLLLKGKLGVGKSYTSVALMKLEYFKNKKLGYFVRCHKLPTMEINELKKYVKNFAYKSIIVLDDIGFIGSNKYVVELVSSVILERIEDNKKTVITTNEDLSNIFDTRVVDKMREVFKVIEIKGDNRRLKK